MNIKNHSVSVFFLYVFFVALGPVFAQPAEDALLFDVPKVTGIAIDGDPSDWLDQGLFVEVMTTPSGGSLPPERFDPRFRLGWDDRGLLLIVTVRDDAVGLGGKPDRLWESDSIELFVAPGTGTDYYQVIVKPRLDPELPMRHAYYDFRRTHPSGEMTAEMAGTGTDNGYILEVLLPWTNHPKPLRIGDEMRMQVLVNNYDGGRLQARWYPDEPMEHSAKGMHRIRLTGDAGPKVRAVAAKNFLKPNHIQLSATAVAELVGQAFEVKVGDGIIASGVFTEKSGRAGADFEISQDQLDDGDLTGNLVCQGQQIGRVGLANPYQFLSPWDPASPCPSVPRRWTFDDLDREGTWRYGSNDDGLILANQLVAVVFAPPAKGAGVTSLYHFTTETEFVPVPAENPRLWEIQVRREDGSITTVSNAAQSRVQFEPRLKKGTLEATLTWPEVAVPGVTGDLAVRVHVVLRAD